MGDAILARELEMEEASLGREELLAALGETTGEIPRIVYVAGEPDCGKTTLCRFLVNGLLAGRGARGDDPAGASAASGDPADCGGEGGGGTDPNGGAGAPGPVAYVDCDPGQSSVGPPTTIGLVLHERLGEQPQTVRLRFVGGVSPVGHFLQLLVGMSALVLEAGRLGARWIVCDSSGYSIGKAAREFQYQAVAMLQPSHLVAFRGSRDIERMTRNFARSAQVRVSFVLPLPERRVRSLEERKDYRRERFSSYLAQASTREVHLIGIGLHGFIPDFSRPETYRGTLISLCDAAGFSLAVGILEEVRIGRGSLSVRCPPFDAAALASIQFGTYAPDCPPG